MIMRIPSTCLLLLLLGGATTLPAGQAPGGGVMRPQPGMPPNGGPPRQGGRLPPQQMPQMGPRLHAGIEMKSYVFEPTGEQLQYAVFVPRKARRSKAPNALIIALHGLGTPPQLIVNDLTDGAERHGYIVVGPSGYRPDGWYGYSRPGAGEDERRKSAYSEQDVLNVLALMRSQYDIDEERIYLAGMSMGGTGALHLGRKYPGKWAAIAAMAPGVPDAGAGFEVMRDTPLMIMIGDRDELLPIEGMRNALARLRGAGLTVQYFEIRGGGHAAPIRGGPPEVFRFFEKHRSRANQQ